MTTLFDRLADRSLGLQPVLRPRVPGLFEPVAPGAGGFVEVTDERAAVAPAAARRIEPRADVSPVATAGRARPAGDGGPPPVAPPTPEAAPRKEPRHPEPAPVAPGLPGTPAPRDRVELVTLRHDHVVTRETQVVAPARRDAPAEAPAEAPKPGGSAGPSEAPAAPAVPRAVAPVPPPPAPIPVAARRLPEPVPAAPAPQAVPPVQRPPERRVEVHIEHLEIRQQPAAAPRRARRAPPVFPGPDLDAYLGRKGR